MKISRFDEVEFEVLDIVSNGFGYYPEGDNADRAERLMEEGILVPSPRVEWQKSGWKFTEDGVEYCKEFMDKVRQVHGHVWVTRNEEYEESDTAGDAPHRFAYRSGFHNGYRCRNCGFEFCIHCENEFSIPKCQYDNSNTG